jgi:fatty acid desaturase
MGKLTTLNCGATTNCLMPPFAKKIYHPMNFMKIHHLHLNQ